VTPAELDQLLDDLAEGKLDAEIPPHGTLGRNRQHIPADRGVGAVPPEQVSTPPAWLASNEAPK
jgi:NADH-quinone oxidoreductase subunit E